MTNPARIAKYRLAKDSISIPGHSLERLAGDAGRSGAVGRVHGCGEGESENLDPLPAVRTTQPTGTEAKPQRMSNPVGTRKPLNDMV
jgi:hypothetical protein